MPGINQKQHNLQMNHQKYIFPCPCDGVGCPREEPLGKPSSIGVFCGMSNGNPTLLVGVLSRFFRLKSGRGVVGRWLLLIGKRAASKFYIKLSLFNIPKSFENYPIVRCADTGIAVDKRGQTVASVAFRMGKAGSGSRSWQAKKIFFK
jgi:hypothetical protein